jgi:ABC-type methionine transport system permease subunit
MVRWSEEKRWVSERTSLLQDLFVEAHLLRKVLSALETLHEATPNVVLAMPLDLLARLSVEDETDGELAVVPHTASNVIAVTKLVGEALALVVEEKTTYATKSLGCEELDFCVGVFGVNETRRVDLDLFKIDT